MIFTSPPPPPHCIALSSRLRLENTCLMNCTAQQKLSTDAPSRSLLQWQVSHRLSPPCSSIDHFRRWVQSILFLLVSADVVSDLQPRAADHLLWDQSCAADLRKHPLAASCVPSLKNLFHQALLAPFSFYSFYRVGVELKAAFVMVSLPLDFKPQGQMVCVQRKSTNGKWPVVIHNILFCKKKGKWFVIIHYVQGNYVQRAITTARSGPTSLIYSANTTPRSGPTSLNRAKP
jgi:hypothetical protein